MLHRRGEPHNYDAVEQALVRRIVEYSLSAWNECVWSQSDWFTYSSSRPFVIPRAINLLIVPVE